MNKKTVGFHFDDCRSFYEQSRKDKIEDLCTAIYQNLHPKAKKLPDFSKDSEYGSWYYSLSDLAELLYDPYTYCKKTIEESRQLINALDEKISSLTSFSECWELSNLLESRSYKDLSASVDISQINKAVDDKAIDALRSLETGLSVLKDGSLKQIIEDLKDQKEELIQATDLMESEETPLPLNDISIDIEYPLQLRGEEGIKRIDVLLSKNEDTFAIIELKQWTEDSINVFLSESEDEKTQCLVNVLPGKRSQLHPAVKVRDIYKKALKEEKGEAAKIRCFVYLHNQLYADSKLFRAYRDMKVNIFDDCTGPNNILYTRLWHKRMLKRFAELFSSEA